MSVRTPRPFTLGAPEFRLHSHRCQFGEHPMHVTVLIELDNLHVLMSETKSNRSDAPLPISRTDRGGATDLGQPISSEESNAKRLLNVRHQSISGEGGAIVP